MRVLLSGIMAVGLAALPATAQTANSKPENEHQELRKLLMLQSEELEVTREQVRQLQRRMATLENQLHLAAEVPGATNAEALPSSPAVVAGIAQRPNLTGVSGDHETETKSDSIELAHGKVRIGTLLYADYAYYNKTGFGPQFLSQINPPGPGNNGFNTFEISRAYINLFYSPKDSITFRLTPDLYRQIGAAPATSIGKVSAIGPNTDQELAFRVKYAYVDLSAPFAGSNAFKKDKLTIGQQQDALIDWEERLWSYRYTSLMPWDYLSGLGAAWAGASLHGPIEFNGRQYLDYEIGVFNNGSYKQLEQSEKKQAMARLTLYPFGARSDLDGLGFTGFYDFGHANVTPDTGVNLTLYRAAALAHYTFRKNAYQIAGEFDAGRNAFTSGNFFSGSGPQDEFGLRTTKFAGFDALVRAVQNGDGTRQRGIAAFGHAQIPRSPLTLFGMYHYFLPNTRVAKNPLDFSRVVAGISYKINDRLQFALTSQNLLFKHSQFTFPATELQLFSPSLAAANPNGIPNAVPNRVQAIFTNMELNF